MSREDAENLYSAIEKSAGLLDVACSRDKVWPMLALLEDMIPQAAISLRVATESRRKGELNCHLMMLPADVDPYALALANGFMAKTDHPVGTLLSDIGERLPLDSYGIDFGIVGGFTKAWSCFPADSRQTLAGLSDIPSMPRSLAENIDFFARYGVDRNVSLVGIDYKSKTVNVYFGEVAECLDPDTVRAMLRELDLPAPGGRLLSFARHAFGFYATLSWDSPKIQRFCYSVMTPDPLALLEQIDPKIEHFLKTFPYGVGAPTAVYLATSPAGDFYKVSSYYQWRSLVATQIRPGESGPGR